jgi:hypothetical protein
MHDPLVKIVIGLLEDRRHGHAQDAAVWQSGSGMVGIWPNEEAPTFPKASVKLSPRCDDSGIFAGFVQSGTNTTGS